MTDPQKDEHIEELLSKLQGIFGKLSHSEEEEAKQKIEIPQSAPRDQEKKETPTEMPPAPKPTPTTPKNAPPSPINLYADPGAPAPSPSSLPTMPPLANTGPAPVASAYESIVPTGDPEKTLIPTAVYFPQGKEAEAKSLAQKLEMMTPKFTKVNFRLRVIVFMSYDPKSDWKDALIAKATESQIQTVFVVVERAMDDAKKKAITAELEGKNVYLQEVPMGLIEKKAFYTDVLLGLVFFFDSHRPPSAAEGTTP